MIEPADQSTRDLVSRDGLDVTLFVEAGAGTGKTTQLVERITNLVLDHGVRLANIAAITFTEAAAAELQSRIRVAFERRLEASQQAGDVAACRRCEEALADVDLAALSTLHGFASRLLTEFAVAAGLPPRVRVLDEVSSQLAHEQRWERFVDRLYADPANEEMLVRARLVDIAFEPRYQGQATLKDVAVELDGNWDRLADVATAESPPLHPIDFAAFDQAVEALAALPDECTDPTDLFCVHLRERLIPEMTAIVQVDDPGRKLARLVDARSAWTGGRGGKNAAWGGDVKAAKQHVNAVNEAVDAVVAQAADDVLRPLLVAISAEVLDAAETRRADGGLEFHDLLVMARELLRSDATARARLHERFTHILLDEFQDTDPIQIELAILIAASIRGDEPGAWNELEVGDGRLFFVGDPKQSIYRFRRADISLFLRARDRFGPGDALARLTTNFRTVGPIVDWVNAYFDAAMAEEHAEKQPRYEPLVSVRETHPQTDHRPILLGGPHPDPKVRAGELRDAEADDVARVVADVRARPDRWMVHDDQADAWRPARLSDVTILVPTRTSLPYLRDALERFDLPYRLATGTLVYDTQEVRDAIAAVRAVDDSSDQLSLVAALRSPLYACSDVDLFTFRAAGGRWDLRGAVPESVPLEHPVRKAFEHLRSLWEQRWWLGPAELLERLLRERRAFLLGLGDPRPTEVWRRLRFLVDQARAFEEAEGGDLRAFVDWAELQGADSARVHEPLLPETDDDAVQILTIHGAKGLEFPITILSGMTTQAGNARRGVTLTWGDDGRPEVRMRKGIGTANHEPRLDLEMEMDVHEKVRLLYVAVTRARDHLVVSGHHSVGRNAVTYAKQIHMFFADRDELWRAFDPPPDDQLSSAGMADRVEPPRSDDREAWVAARQALLARDRVPRVVSATAVARTVAPDLDDEDDDQADAVDDATVPVRRQGRAGSAIGRAVHATLQLLDLADPHDLDAIARRECDAESIPELAEQVAQRVRSALTSDAVALARTHPHHKELYVAAPLGDRVVEGYVDLLVETPEGLVVVDYKTDSARSEADIDAKLAAYELQGATYAVALEAAVGGRVVDCRFVFCQPTRVVERSVHDLPAAMARVRRTVAGVA